MWNKLSWNIGRNLSPRLKNYFVGFRKNKKIVDTMNQFLVGITAAILRIEWSFEDLEEPGAREVLFLDINLFILLTDWPYCDTIGCFKRQQKAHCGMKSHVHLSP
jgi:hypothetical protein